MRSAGFQGRGPHRLPSPTAIPDLQPNAWNRLATFVLKARRLGVVFVGLALLAMACLPLLRFDFSPQTLFDSTSGRAELWRKYRAIYGADDHVMLALVEAPAHEARTWRLLAGLEEQITARVPEVEDLRSLVSLPVPRSDAPGVVAIAPLASALPANDAEAAALASQARDHPLISGTLISSDGSAVAVFMKARDDVAAMAQVKPVVQELRRIAQEAEATHPGARVHLLGPHPYRVTVVGVMISEELRFVPLTGLVLFAVLWLLYRSIIGVLIPLCSVGLGALWTAAAMALAGQEVNIINTITATLILVIGVADAIHMMTRYGQERRAGRARDVAVRRTLASVGLACLLTSLTTAVGFMTLGTAQLAILRSFGLFAALGVMLTFSLSIVFVPWALARSTIDPVVRGGAGAEPSTLLGRFLDRQRRLVQRRPRRVALISLAIAGVFAAGIPRTTVDNYIMEYVPRDEAILEAHHVLEEKLAGIVFLEILLEVPEGGPAEPWLDPALLARAADVEARVLADPAIQSVDSVLGLLRELRWVQRGGAGSGEARDVLPGSRAEAASLLLLAEMTGEESAASTHLSFDRRVLRLTARAKDVGARRYLQLEKRLRSELEGALAGSSVAVRPVITGTSQVGYGGIDSLIRDLLRSLAWAFVLIFATLVLLFRSWKLAGLAMIPNVLPVVVVLGAMGWTGQHLETLSAMVFSIGLGIAVDDTIHYLARWCENVRAGHSPAEAVALTTLGTGRAIVYTSLVLLLGFGVLFTSRFPPNQSFALLAGGVIAVALAADLYLLPALLLWLRPHVPGTPR